MEQSPLLACESLADKTTIARALGSASKGEAVVCWPHRSRVEVLCARLERRDAWGAGADRSDLRAVVGELRDLRAWRAVAGEASEGVGRSTKSRETPEKNEQDQKQQQQ